jgi:hypothetical protein
MFGFNELRWITAKNAILAFADFVPEDQRRAGFAVFVRSYLNITAPQGLEASAHPK